MAEPNGHRDVICMGASAGGIAATVNVLRQLPADLEAAVFVVIHIPRTGPSLLPAVLQCSTKLQVRRAVEGEPLEHGTVYVAPTDRHLLVLPDRVALGRGPTENRVRPAVDALFRSAAVSHSSRVIGVVLSGSLDDGAAGLAAIKRCGGRAVVQDPEEADSPGMPRAAIEATDPDAILPVGEIGPLLRRMIAEAAVDAPPAPVPLSTEVGIALSRNPGASSNEPLGDLVPLGCPDCGGPLTRIDDQVLRFRCHTGHAYGASSLTDQQGDEINRTLSTALRLFEERAHMLRRMAREQDIRGHAFASSSYDRRAADAEDHAARLRHFLDGVFDAA